VYGDGVLLGSVAEEMIAAEKFLGIERLLKRTLPAPLQFKFRPRQLTAVIDLAGSDCRVGGG
jgi:hypothetical protein